MGLKKTQEKEYAKVLFVQESLTAKEIAERIGVTEKTLAKWVEDGEWKKLKRSLLNTKQNQLILFYDQLEWLNNQIATREIVYDVPASLLKPTKVKDAEGNERLEYPVYEKTDFPILIGNVATSKEADVLSKLTASINRLEVETSIGEIYEVAKQAIDIARGESHDFAKKVTALFDTLIQTKLKR